MPELSRWYIKLSFIWLLLALSLSILQLLPGVQSNPVLQSAAPLRFHFLMVGWVMQLIFGVMYWMFPKASAERPRGRGGWNWAAFILLNTGLLLRGLTEPLLFEGPSVVGILLAISGFVQWMAVVIFTIEAWPRLR
jgi:hypothetical protein